MKDIPSINFSINGNKKKKDGFADKFYKNFFAQPKNHKMAINPEKVFERVVLPKKYKDNSNIDQETIQRIKNKHETKGSQNFLFEKDIENKNIGIEDKKNNIEDNLIHNNSDRNKYEANKNDFLKKRSFSELENNEGNIYDYFKNKNEQIFEDPSYLKEEVNEIFKNFEKRKKNKPFQEKNLFSKKEKRIKLNFNIFNEEKKELNPEDILSRIYINFIPEINWWDKVFLKEKKNIDNVNNFESKLKKIKEIEIMDFPMLPVVNEEEKNITLPFFYTNEEIKKTKKKEKLEKQREIQEKIKYGILQPLPPKMKLSNFTKIFENETILNPTKIEKIVQDQIEERKKKYFLENENKKLSKEGKEDKKLRKIKKDMSQQLFVYLILIEYIPDFNTIFKIEQFASKYFLNGFLMIPSKDFEIRKPLIIYESGAMFSKKFEKYLQKHFLKQFSEKNIKVDNHNDKGVSKEDFFHKIWFAERKDHFYESWKILRPKNLLEIEKIFYLYHIANILPIYLNYLKIQ